MYYNQEKIISEMYHRTGFTSAELKILFDGLQDVITEHVRNHDEIKLFRGFSIIGVERPAKMLIVPTRDEPIPQDAFTSAKLKLGEPFRRAINYHYEY